MIHIQCRRTLLILPEKYLFQFLPADVLAEAVKRGKGFKRAIALKKNIERHNNQVLANCTRKLHNEIKNQSTD